MKIKHIVVVKKDYGFLVFMFLIGNIILGIFLFAMLSIFYYACELTTILSHDFILSFVSGAFVGGMLLYNYKAKEKGIYEPYIEEVVEHRIEK